MLGAQGIFVSFSTSYLEILFLSYCRHSRCGHTGARCRWLRGRESEGRSLGVRVSRLGGLGLGFGIAALISKKQRESKGVSRIDTYRLMARRKGQISSPRPRISFTHLRTRQSLSGHLPLPHLLDAHATSLSPVLLLGVALRPHRSLVVDRTASPRLGRRSGDGRCAGRRSCRSTGVERGNGGGSALASSRLRLVVARTTDRVVILLVLRVLFQGLVESVKTSGDTCV